MDEVKRVYKKHCDSQCLLGKCETRSQGGCYCVCRISDSISSLRGLIDGHNFFPESGGIIYIADEEHRKKYYDRMSDLEKNNHDDFKNRQAPRIIIELEEMLKEYEE